MSAAIASPKLGRQRRREDERLPVHNPPPYREEDVYALKALAEGIANPGQQEMALQFILREVCGMYVDPFLGATSDREVAYNLGRQSVARVVSTLVDAEIVETPRGES